MATAFYRHLFKQGEAYSVDVDLQDANGAIDTTNWTGASNLKTLDGITPVDSANNPIAFTVAFPTTGTVRFSLTTTQTAQLLAKRYLYDAKLTDSSGTPAYYLDGDVIVRRSITP